MRLAVYGVGAIGGLAAARLAEAGRKRVQTTYTWDQTARGYLRAIRGKMENPPRHEPCDGHRFSDLDASDLIKRYAADQREDQP